jgi:hypothetical protein
MLAMYLGNYIQLKLERLFKKILYIIAKCNSFRLSHPASLKRRVTEENYKDKRFLLSESECRQSYYFAATCMGSSTSKYYHDFSD